jgi:hypothetical protein
MFLQLAVEVEGGFECPDFSSPEVEMDVEIRPMVSL